MVTLLKIISDRLFSLSSIVNRLWLRIVFLLILWCSSCPSAFSQEIFVDSFRALDNDLTANTYGTMEYDQNGEPAALIKVVTSETGFVFNGGMLGIVKTIQQAGEIWVYVPFGIQRITIAHPDLGVLRDYFFPVSIEKARTYELKLRTVRLARSEAELTPVVNVTFVNPMENSGIYLSGVLVGTGSWSGQVAATDFILEVKQEGYVTYSTTITFNPDEHDKTITIPQLEPVKGIIRADSDPSGAKVYVDGVFKGKSPILIENLNAGIYSIQFRKHGYRPYITTVSVKTEETYKAETSLRRVNQNVYAGVGYQSGHVSGLTALAGIYLWNINLEVGYLKPFISSERTYWITSPETWTGNTTSIAYDFNLKSAFSASLGYGFPIGKRLNFTPNAGVSFYDIEGIYSSEGNEINSASYDDCGKARTYLLSGKVSARIEYSPVKHLFITLSPSYELPFEKGDMASVIDESTDFISMWCRGFSFTACLKVYF